MEDRFIGNVPALVMSFSTLQIMNKTISFVDIKNSSFTIIISINIHIK